MVVLVAFWPGAVVHVRERTDPTLRGWAAKRLVLHLLICNVACRIVHRSGWGRHEEGMDAADRAIGGLSLVEKVGRRELPLARSRKGSANGRRAGRRWVGTNLAGPVGTGSVHC